MGGLLIIGVGVQVFCNDPTVCYAFYRTDNPREIRLVVLYSLEAKHLADRLDSRGETVA